MDSRDVALLLGPLMLVACSTTPATDGDTSETGLTGFGSTSASEPTSGDPDPTSPSGGSGSTSGTTATQDGSSDTGDPSSTMDGSDGSDSTGAACAEDCGEGECIDGSCCAPESVCDGVCCGEGDICSFLECVTPGADCIDASECAADEYCEYSLGDPEEKNGGECPGGASLATGQCLPSPPECAPGVVPEADDIDCLPECEVVPDPSFSPEVKYHWDGGNPMMAPIVLQLDDDNCDEEIDERDLPEIVFATFRSNQYNVNGTLHAISVVDGEIVEKWSVNPQDFQIQPGRSIAGGDIDGLPGNEVVVCLTNGGVRAYRGDGTVLWTSTTATGCFMPAIADLDQDGTAEIILRTGILDGVTGANEATYSASGMLSVGVSDLDGDGTLEVAGPTAAFEADGTLIASTGIGGTHAAVADFDLDGAAEIVSINNPNHSLAVWRIDDEGAAEIIRQGININGALGACSGGTGGGPPTVADFNGDGTPDVGVAAGVGYAVFDGAALMNPAVSDAETLLWITPAVDCSSRSTGSSVFDFDGNGQAEVIYGDQEYLRIYDGPTGEVLFETCNTTGTLYEYPLVADVDNDGHADIVAIANDYSSITCPTDGSRQRGVRIFGDEESRWVRTRRIWNQHSYHVTNVEEDGSIPLVETPNWTVPGLNNFRQNVQPEGEFSAPDLVVSIGPDCLAEPYALVATVRNIGRAAVPAGVPVDFYAGDPDAGGILLGSMETTKDLYPAEGEELVLEPNQFADELFDGLVDATVVVADGDIPNALGECRPDNNHASAYVECIPPG